MNDAPLIFAGLRIKTLNNISMSLGLITGWYKELHTLNVGDPVSGDGQLLDDYRYQPTKNPGVYIGLQYSF